MQWKPRRTIWPPIVALVCLLIITLAAPRIWRNYREQLRRNALSASSIERAMAAEDTAESESVNQPATIAQPQAPAVTLPPPLPPMVREGARHNRPDASLVAPVANPILGNGDYDDYGEELFEDYTVVDEAAERRSTPLSLRPITSTLSEGIVAAPVQLQEFSLSTLLQIQGAYESLLESAGQRRERVEAEARKRTQPVVRVENPGDRLAMLPTERSILVSPQPTESFSLNVPANTEPRLARAPSREETAEVEREVPSSPIVVEPALRSRPEELIADLVELSKRPVTHDWAEQVLRRLEPLTELPQGPDTVDGLRELSDLARKGREQGLITSELETRTRLLRTAASLQRRLPVWQAMLDSHLASAAELENRPVDGSQLTPILHEIAALLAGSEAGTHWRSYLHLDGLAELATTRSSEADLPPSVRATQRELAQRTLARMADTRLSEAQQSFLTSEPFVALEQELRRWTPGPVRLSRLASVIELYETKPTMRYAQALAEFRQRMRWSKEPGLRELAKHLEQAYRNPNLRMAVTGDLLNRLTPKAEPVVSPVRDHVAGADIRGRAKTTTHVSVRLTPDPNAWRIALEADGKVRSNTYSDTWPARVRNAGNLQFEAEKEIVITREGLKTAPAEATASGRNRLVGVDSSFEPVPLLGPIVEGIARQKHSRSSRSAMSRVKRKVVREAETRMDRVADSRMKEIEAGFQQYVLGPIETLALAAEPVDLYTTEKRAVMRLRMANQSQLGAYTPRPSAPSDSLASLQLHESALNNAVRGLELDGRRMSAGELHALLSLKLTGSVGELPADLPARAKIEFAQHDAVRVRCDGDRLEVCLAFAELARGRDRIRNFEVHTFFKPQLEGLQVKLVRDGTLQFSGPRLRTGPRVILHSVFGRLLQNAEEVPLLAERIQTDPRFEGLMVTQLVIEDGWIALAMGPYHPQRVAWRTREVRNTRVAERVAPDNRVLR